MVTSLYASLAASASVFIGILTALLVSDLSNIKAEQSRIRRRVEAIDSRLRSLRYQREVLEDRLDNIEEIWEEERAKKQAEEQVDDFIDYAEDNITQSDFTPRMILQEFADFIDAEVGNLNDNQKDELRNKRDDIERAFEPPKPDPFLGISHNLHREITPITKPEYVQIEQQRQLRRDEKYTRDDRQLIQTITEMRSLHREREKLETRYRSLDPASIVHTLLVSVVAIIASVVVPSVFLAFRVTDTVLVPLPNWVEPTAVFLLWAVGLALVFFYLGRKLWQDPDKLPEEPEMETSMGKYSSNDDSEVPRKEQESDG